LIHQRKDIQINQEALKAQVEEFKAQKIEMVESRKVYEEQSQTLAQQRFETTFFNLLNIYLEKKLKTNPDKTKRNELFYNAVIILQNSFINN